MRRSDLTVAAVVVMALTAACGGSPPVTTTTPTITASAPPSAAAGTLDPCLLVTSQEASALSGITFVGAGEEKTIAANSKQCIYGNQGSYIFTVGVIQAPSAAEAQAGEQEAVAFIESQLEYSLKVTQVPSFADGGVEIQGMPQAGVSASAIYALHGTIAFGFATVGVNHPVPTNAAMLPVAAVMLSRLP
jgi:hypothetical protein